MGFYFGKTAPGQVKTSPQAPNLLASICCAAANFTTQQKITQEVLGSLIVL
jgi:hypothetical protein